MKPVVSIDSDSIVTPRGRLLGSGRWQRGGLYRMMFDIGILEKIEEVVGR